MVSANVNRVLEESMRLSLDERRQLLALLSAGEERSPLSDNELDGVLISRGVMLASPHNPTAEDTAVAENWLPLVIEGKPLSETIIEDRR